MFQASLRFVGEDQILTCEPLQPPLEEIDPFFKFIRFYVVPPGLCYARKKFNPFFFTKIIADFISFHQAYVMQGRSSTFFFLQKSLLILSHSTRPILCMEEVQLYFFYKNHCWFYFVLTTENKLKFLPNRHFSSNISISQSKIVIELTRRNKCQKTYVSDLQFVFLSHP